VVSGCRSGDAAGRTGGNRHRGEHSTEAGEGRNRVKMGVYADVSRGEGRGRMAVSWWRLAPSNAANGGR